MGEPAELELLVEALLFLSPKPLSAAELAALAEAEEEQVGAALAALADRYRPGKRGVQRRANLTPAQLETLAIVAYLQPVSRAEIARIRGVSADSALNALLERELIEEAGRSPAGATLFQTTDRFLRRFGLRSLEDLPDPARFDPSPEELASLRERLLRAGELRAGATPPLEGGGENGRGG